MISEFHRLHIQRTVLAVEHKLVVVKDTVRNRVDGLGILHHRAAVLPQLKFLHALDVTVPGIFIPDLQRKGVESVGKILRQLRHRKPAFIRLPDRTVIDIPDAAVPVEPCYRLEEVGEGIPDADLIPLVSRICVWLHLLQRKRNAGKIRSKRGVLFLGGISIQIHKFILSP